MNRYFYIDNQGAQKGTFSPEELRGEGLKKDTLVWTQGMSEWKRAAEVSELDFLFAENPYAGFQQPMPPPVGAFYTPQSQQQPQEPMPKNWLLESILATVLPFLFCSSVFSLLGIIGIVHASQVESNYLKGDYNAALESSKKARQWTKIALWIAAGWLLLWIIGIVVFISLIGSMAGFEDLIHSGAYEI